MEIRKKSIQSVVSEKNIDRLFHTKTACFHYHRRRYFGHNKEFSLLALTLSFSNKSYLNLLSATVK